MTSEIQTSNRLHTAMPWLICLFAFSLPLSIAAAEPLLLLCVLAWVAGGTRSQWRQTGASPYAFPVLLFALLAAASALWSVRPEVTVGRLHRVLFPLAIFVMGRAYGDETRKEGPAVWHPVLAFCGAAALLGVFDIFRVQQSINAGTELPYTGNMRDPQMYLVAVCMLAAFGLVKAWHRWRPFIILALLPIVAALVLHLKRGVWLSLCMALVLLALCSKRWKIVVAVVLCAAAALAIPPVRARVVGTVDLMDPDVGGRYALWTEVAPALIKEYPQGMGWSAPTHADLLAHTEHVQEGLRHMHNNILQMIVELGWAGLAIWLAWIGVALLVAWRGYRGQDPEGATYWVGLGVFCALCGLLANGMVEYNFGDSEILMLYCMLMGLSEAVRRSGQGNLEGVGK